VVAARAAPARVAAARAEISNPLPRRAAAVLPTLTDALSLLSVFPLSLTRGTSPAPD